MINVGSAGRSGIPAAAPDPGRSAQPKAPFDAALSTARGEAGARAAQASGAPGAAAPSLEELKERGAADLGRLRLRGLRVPEEAGSLLGRCRAALDALEAGRGGQRERETLHQAYDALVCATQGEYGHLPHDDLTRILAMAQRAQKEGGFEG